MNHPVCTYHTHHKPTLTLLFSYTPQVPRWQLDFAVAVHQAGRPHPDRRQVRHLRRAQFGGARDRTRSVQRRCPGIAGDEVEDHHLYNRAGKYTKEEV